ncbi:TPA: hypothetical protein DCE37_05560 [Candidatus Latescibacteria bacterium]|nr:hypothetical protein [Candidatus Latescibacterota bacterium]
MFDAIAWSAFGWGALAAVSLPLGAVVGLLTRPTRRVASSAMAFGGGALLFALSIELFGHVLHRAGDGHGHITQPKLVFAAIIAGIVGGLLFNGLNAILEDRGGFLRRRGMIRRHVVRRRRAEARQLFESLARVDYFRELPVEEVIALMPDVETVTFEPDATVFSEGDEGDGLYVIADGVVRIERASEGAQAEIATIGQGDVFGEMSLVTENPRSATAVTVNEVKAWRISTDSFHRHMDESPNLKAAIQKVVTERIQNLHESGHVTEETAGDWTNLTYKRLEDHTTVGVTTELVQSETSQHGHAATAIWLGIALDAIPESLVIGMLVVAAAASGTTLSLAFIAGVFLANLPEAMSSAVTMQKGGMSTLRIFLMWFSLCVLTAVGAYVGATIFPANPTGSKQYVMFAIEGLAGGAMLTMIAQTMLPEAFEQGGGPIVGLSTLCGFLAALMVKMI